jgi:alpha-amylase/alpha-mannosidase (GH57 family)
LLIDVSQPVSKFNTSKLENFLSPVTILAASSCIFFILSESYSKHPSNNSHAYSKSGLIKVNHVLNISVNAYLQLHLTSVDTTLEIMKMMYSPDVDYE